MISNLQKQIQENGILVADTKKSEAEAKNREEEAKKREECVVMEIQGLKKEMEELEQRVHVITEQKSKKKKKISELKAKIVSLNEKLQKMKEEYDSNLENLHKQNESVELKYNSLLHQHQQLESQLKLIETSTLSKLQLREEQEKDHQELVKQFNKLQKQNNEQAIAIQDLQEKLSRSSVPPTPKKRKAEEISDVAVVEKIPITKETDDDDSKRGNVHDTPKNKKRNRTHSLQSAKKSPKLLLPKKKRFLSLPFHPKVVM